MQLFLISWLWQLKQIFEKAVRILSTDSTIAIVLIALFILVIIVAIVVLVIILLRLTAIILLALRIISKAMAQSPSSRKELAHHAAEAKPRVISQLGNWLKWLLKNLPLL